MALSLGNMITPRQALVFGNEAYAQQPLEKCVNDAVDVSNALHSIGFRVLCAKNARYNSMQTLSYQFVQSIQPGSIVIFYFSGHGLQYNGINYLIPTDNRNLAEESLDQQALHVQDLIDDMYERNPRLMIIILDCCRGYGRKSGLDRSHFFHRTSPKIKDGLAPMQAPPATIIAYACAENEVSTTLSKNDRNSLYTYHLLNHIGTPNLDIDLVLRRVAVDVQKDPLNIEHQVPFRYSSCNEIICLVDNLGINASQFSSCWPLGLDLQRFKKQYKKANSIRHSLASINTLRYQPNMPNIYRAARTHPLSRANRFPTRFGSSFRRQSYTN